MSCIDKIIDIASFENQKAKGLFKDQKIVFTNGCFDILHSGHVLYLQEAKSLGDVLILGLNSDDSIKRLKGAERPINNEQDRAIVLAGLSFVDFIIVFDEDTPLNLIKHIQPSVLAKGGDWAIEQIVGSDIVMQSGGEVRALMFKDGSSTTDIINKIAHLSARPASQAEEKRGLGEANTEYDTGVIKSIDGNDVVIVRENTGACLTCRLKNICHIQNKIEFSIETGQDFEVGEKVEIIVNPQTRIWSSFIVYIMPILVLILFYYLSSGLLKASEIISMIVSFFSLIVSFVVIKLLNRKFAGKNEIKIQKLFKNI